MNLNYSEEQTMLREQIQKFCETEYDFYKREDVVKSDNDFDENVWALFAEQGWLSMPFSEESGGFGFGPIELSVLFEEFGKALVIEPYLSTVVLSGTLLDKSNFSGKACQHCNSGYVGENCQYSDLITCNGNGTVHLNELGNVYCICNRGYIHGNPGCFKYHGSNYHG